MKSLKILNSREKKKIFEQIKDQFGFLDKLEGVFLQSSKNQLFYLSEGLDILKSGDDKQLRVDRAGLHIADIDETGVWLTVEGTQLIGPECGRNILQLNDVQLEAWLKGENFFVEPEEKDGFFILKYKDDFLGCGYMKKGILKNFLSKTRILKNVNM